MFTKEIVMDLGTANTRVFIKSKDIILDEPSVVAYDVRDDAVKAVGTDAKEMIGRTPGSIVAVRPIKGGVIADFDVTSAMIKLFLRQALRGSLLSKTNLLISIPSGATEVEARAVHDAAKQAGANEVTLIEGSLAAALGANLPVYDAAGSMVVNIGGGTAEAAILSLGGIVTAHSIKVGGDAFDDTVRHYLRKRHGLIVGDRTAEQLKIDIGSALPYDGEQNLEIRGRGLVDGLPSVANISPAELRDAFDDLTEQIVDLVRATLEKTPPELAADIIDRGITLTGGGAQLRRLDTRISEATGMPVHIVANPTDCTVLGAGSKIGDSRSVPDFSPYNYRRNK